MIMSTSFRLNTLRTQAKGVGLLVETSSPGDGKTRYNFMAPSASGNPYTYGRTVGTAVGMAEAEVWMRAYQEAYYNAGDNEERQRMRELVNNHHG